MHHPSSARCLGLLLLLCAHAFAAPAATDLSGQPIYRFLCVADPTNSLAWQFPLWEKLFSAGYLVEFTGSHTNSSRIGPLKFEPYSDKTAELLHNQPPDVVLVDTDTPDVAMIRAFRDANPRVAILLTQSLRARELTALNSPELPMAVVLPAADPEKTADRWFDALQKILDPPKQSYRPKTVVYKKASDRDLTLNIFKPTDKSRGPHPAIVFFFGGGWKIGTPIQFYAECAHFAAEGFVAISADYRIESVDHTSPFECVTDAKSALRWVRAHARHWDIDPDRIVGAGASAGGHIAAAAAFVKDLDDPADDLAVSPRPDALVLWCAVIDNGPGGYGYNRVKDRYREISPLHNITAAPPPTLFLLGTKDQLIPIATAANFKARIDKAGGRCDLKLFEGARHGLNDYRKGDNQLRRDCLAAADDFLSTLGYLPARH